MRKTILLLYTMSVLCSCNEKTDKCILSGTVINPQDDTIILYMPNQDPWYDNIINIPIENGHFRYECEVMIPTGYDLMYGNNGQPEGRYMTVFLEKGEIELVIYPENEWDKNTVVGGLVNETYNILREYERVTFTAIEMALNRKQRQLIEENNYYSDEMLQLREERQNADAYSVIVSKIDSLRKANANLSVPAQELQEEFSKVQSQKNGWNENYIRSNTNAISYYWYFTELCYGRETVYDEINSNYNRFISAFPNHPYNESFKLRLFSMENIRVGAKYIDFTAKDLFGKSISLSSLIENKVTLIDLWASWCGPCIRRSREIVPIYNEFNEKGFTVVGVAGEFEDTKRLESRLKKEKFPWINLVELDRENSIWELYGASNSSGRIILVDNTGIIVSIDPTSKEIRQLLPLLLKNTELSK